MPRLIAALTITDQYHSTIRLLDVFSAYKSAILLSAIFGVK